MAYINIINKFIYIVHWMNNLNIFIYNIFKNIFIYIFLIRYLNILYLKELINKLNLYYFFNLFK